eukprot:TRINITY_DN104861_c0_g1_i1.p1 TRINITY_DN104861_c0_g1~~TRINITY_DN104861_c0_g1_i1.p1  ORF type:complete len:284 (+),score=30.48 TRINITY_DN104861_c0_g1_i1:69-920(+)
MVDSGEQEELKELLPSEYTRSAELVAFHLAVLPKTRCGELLKILSSIAPLGESYLHLKRVRPRPSAGLLEVLICCADAPVPDEVTSLLTSHDIALEVAHVPRHGALTRDQLASFSQHWPLTYRRPAWEPLDVTSDMKRMYLTLMSLADSTAQGGSSCVVADRSGKVLGVGKSDNASPLRHAVMVAIEAVSAARTAAADKSAEVGSKRARADEEYLCQDCEVVTTHEPCVMCAMALVHSRVRSVVYREADVEFGGLGGAVSLHHCNSLNHQLRVLRLQKPAISQ